MTNGGAAEPQLPKRWRRKARGGPPEGWISKKAPDEPGDGILAPESGSRAHKHRGVELSPSEKSGAWWHVDDCFSAGFLQRVARPRAPRNLRSSVGEELAGKSHRRRGDLIAAAAAKGSRRRIKCPKGNMVTEKEIRFSPLALIPCEERKWRIPNFYYVH